MEQKMCKKSVNTVNHISQWKYLPPSVRHSGLEKKIRNKISAFLAVQYNDAQKFPQKKFSGRLFYFIITNLNYFPLSELMFSFTNYEDAWS